jgi:hypothetical protein
MERESVALLWDGVISPWMRGSKMGSPAITGKAAAGHSPVLTWLSLVGLLPSRARLRFTRQVEPSLQNEPRQ